MEWDFIENLEIDEATLESKVPEPYKSYYVVAEGGGYVLDPKVRPLAEAYSGVNKKLGATSKDKTNFSKEAADRRASLNAIKETLTELGIEAGDDIPAILKTKLTELMDQARNGKDISVNLEKIKQDHQRRMDETVGLKNKELTAMEASLERHMIGQVAASALAEAKTVQNGVDFLMPHIKAKTKVFKDENGEYTVRVVDAQGDARSDGRGGWMTVRDLVAEMKTTFPMAFESTTPSGTGTRGTQTDRRPAAKKDDLTSVQKISEGLKETRK
jgi:hypothetical protein